MPRGFFQQPASGAVPLAQQVEHLDLIARARIGSGLTDLAEHVAAGNVFYIARRDRVVVVDDALTASLVVVLDGEHHGRSGWVPAAWLHASFSYGATTVSEGVLYRASPQLYWSLPHASLLADYVAVSQGIERPGFSDRVETQAWQVGASWVLTGERPTYAGVKPKSAFAPGAGTWGAWELVARYGRLDVDDKVFSDGFRTRAQTASGVTTIAVGVNWYPTAFLKWQTALEESVFDDGAGTVAAVKDRDPEHFLITRLSLFF